MTLHDRVDPPITGVRLLGLCKAAPPPASDWLFGNQLVAGGPLEYDVFVKE